MHFLISPFSKCGLLLLQVCCLFIVSSGGGGVAAQVMIDSPPSKPRPPPEKDLFGTMFNAMVLEADLIQLVGLI